MEGGETGDGQLGRVGFVFLSSLVLCFARLDLLLDCISASVALVFFFSLPYTLALVFVSYVLPLCGSRLRFFSVLFCLLFPGPNT